LVGQLGYSCSALDAYHESTSVLPQITAFDLNLNSRQEQLTRVREYISILVSASAAYAVRKEYGLAVEFLEASRSVFWAQALQPRTPLDKLESAKDPRSWDLAEKLKDLARQPAHIEPYVCKFNKTPSYIFCFCL
jgi:hypothetical protein